MKSRKKQLMDDSSISSWNNISNHRKREMSGEDVPTTWHTYMSTKKAKLNDQFAADVSRLETSLDDEQGTNRLFAGIRIHTNGCANPSNEELRELIGRYGGTHDFYFNRETTTHVVAQNLAYTKVKFFRKCIVVRPEWITDSIAAGNVLPCDKYLIPLTGQHQPYRKAETHVSDSESEGEDGVDVDDDFGFSLSDRSEEDGDTHDVSETSLREKQSTNSTSLKAGDPGFLEEFFSRSRLHHLSTAGNEFKAYVQEKRSSGVSDFVGLQRLKRFVDEMKLKTSVQWTGPMIMHIDMDCFFVSVGLLNKPHLRDKPVVVAHAKTGRGERLPDQPTDQMNSFSELASCNYEARKFGIKNGMFLRQALKLCPLLHIIPYNFAEYDRVSKTLYDLVCSFTLEVEAVSCDEMFVDIKNVVTEAKCEPKVFANFIRQEMKRLTQCDASVGIAPNVLVAKLASKAAKPNNFVIIPPEEVLSFMSDQQLEQLPGVGYSISSKLAEKFSAEKCSDMMHVPCERLRDVFGHTMGEKLFSLVRGMDRSDLKFDQASARKSVSVEVNYGIRFEEWSKVESFLHELSQETSNRLRNINAKGKSITLKIKVRRQDAPVQTAKFMGHGICDNLSRSTLLSFPSDDKLLIARSVINIMQSMKVHVPDLRGIAIQISKLSFSRPSQQPTEESVTENSNSIQKFFKPQSEPPFIPSKMTNPTVRRTPVVDLTLEDIDPDVLEELPEELRKEITDSLNISQLQPSAGPSKQSKPSSSKTKSKSPKKKPLPPAKPGTGPLDRMFNSLKTESLEKKVTNIMNIPATLCGQSDVDKVTDLLTEWVVVEEKLNDEDVAYVTKFLLDIISLQKWSLLQHSLATLRR